MSLCRGLSRPELERHAELLLTHLVSMLGAPTSNAAGAKSVHEAVTHAMRAGLGETLSERGQARMAASLATAATSRDAVDGSIVVCLKEVAMLLQCLREVATATRDTLLQGERSLLLLVEHPASAVRTAACACLWALILAFPNQLAGLLNASINRE